MTTAVLKENPTEPCAGLNLHHASVPPPRAAALRLPHTPGWRIFPTMSPVVFSEGRFRFLFFSNEEKRMHVHVLSPDGEAKFWLEPIVSLAKSTGLLSKDLSRLQRIIEERQDEIKRRWKKHLAG
jgi:hypothetical protein